MAIDFSLSPELEEIRLRVRKFIDDVVRPARRRSAIPRGSSAASTSARSCRCAQAAATAGLWLPHMPKEWGGMGLGHVELAMVQAEAAKAGFGPFVLNCQAPDEGNMHTLLHWATDEQKEKYLRPLCDGTSCVVLRDDRARGRGLRPDADPDARRAATATTG